MVFKSTVALFFSHNYIISPAYIKAGKKGQIKIFFVLERELAETETR